MPREGVTPPPTGKPEAGPRGAGIAKGNPPSGGGVTGLILAGGESRRMGRDKACLPWGSVTLIEDIITTLRPVVDELIVSVRDARQLPHLSVRVVEDTVSRAHALGGLYTGLRAASNARCFVCACDAPFLKPRLIRFLIKEADGYDLVVPQTAQGLHPLHAVYAKSALPVIEAQLRRRQWRLHDVARKVRVKQIPPEVLVQYDPSGISLFNLNTPTDYARAWDDAHHGRRAGSSVAYAFGHPLGQRVPFQLAQPHATAITAVPAGSSGYLDPIR